MGWAVVLTCPIGHMNTPRWNWKSPLSPRYMLGGRQNQDPQARHIWTVLYFSRFQNPFECVFDFCKCRSRTAMHESRKWPRGKNQSTLDHSESTFYFFLLKIMIHECHLRFFFYLISNFVFIGLDSLCFLIFFLGLNHNEPSKQEKESPPLAGILNHPNRKKNLRHMHGRKLRRGVQTTYTYRESLR